MSQFDRALWEQRTKSENRWQDLEKRSNAAVLRLRQAAIPLERLTGSDHWDQFLRLGEQRQEDDRKELKGWTACLTGPDYIAPEEAARIRWLVGMLQVRIQTRQELLDLPKVILQTLSEVNG